MLSVVLLLNEPVIGLGVLFFCVCGIISTIYQTRYLKYKSGFQEVDFVDLEEQLLTPIRPWKVGWMANLIVALSSFGLMGYFIVLISMWFDHEAFRGDYDLLLMLICSFFLLMSVAMVIDTIKLFSQTFKKVPLMGLEEEGGYLDKEEI